MSDYQKFDLINGQVCNIQGRMTDKLKAIPLPDLTGKRVLDIGCDHGFWTFLSAEKAKKVVALDRGRPVQGEYVDLVAKNAKTAADHNIQNVEFRYMNFGKQWHDQGKYDVIYLFSLYHHIYQNTGGDHDSIWFWLSRQIEEDGELLWENPYSAEDSVVERNVDSRYWGNYSLQNILKAAAKYFTYEYIGEALHEPTRKVYRFKPLPMPDRKYTGHTRSGAGGASKAFEYSGQRRVGEFKEVIGKEFYCGSLNVELDRDFHYDTDYFRCEILDVVKRGQGLDVEWQPRWARIYPLILNGHQGYAFRFEGESYPLNFVEVLASIRLRDYITTTVNINYSISIVCVNVENYCSQGTRYVNNLYKAVKENFTLPFNFYCISDQDGYEKGVNVIKADGSNGWYSKIYMFKLFTGRTIYFDLDTIIAGNIDYLARSNHLAMLTDFYFPENFGSGVMTWAGDYSHIYDNWVEQDKPSMTHGDQEWIAYAMQQEVDSLQDLYPDQIYSYKAHDLQNIKGSVICFHGQPKPHNASKWAIKEWSKHES